MDSISVRPQDGMVMSLVHYFVTKENYSPIIVHGSKNEVWLENLEGPYKVIRINNNYIHNSEQYEYDVLKVENVIKQIKKKTLSFNFNTLNICVNIGDYVKPSKTKGIETINAKNIKDFTKQNNIKTAFPEISKKINKEIDKVDHLFSMTTDINDKTEKSNKVFENIFRPKRIIMTKIMMALCIVVFALTYILGKGSEDPITLVMFGANYAPLVKSGQIWRLLTSMFLHAGFLHLAINMYALYMLGSQVENYIGKLKFTGIYLVSGIIGSLMSVLFTNNISVGASGAIFGLAGALLYFGFHFRLYLSNALKNQILPIVIINLALGFLIPGIDVAAHIGGLIGGYLSTASFGIVDKTSKQEKINASVALIILIAFLSYMIFR